MEGRLIPGILLLLFLPGLALADAVNNEWLSTTRALSMGNVGIASADDGVTAAFYNPAALSRLRRATLEFFNLQLEASGGAFSVSGGAGNLGKNLNLDKLAPLLKAHPGQGSYLGASVFPNIHAQNFSFGILTRAEGGAYYDKASDTYVYRSRWLLMPSLGISMSLVGGRVRLGAAVRGIQITENDRSVSSSQANIGYTVDPQQGFGVGLDTGMLFTMPWPWLPTLGFVARNVGDTSFPGAAPVSVGTGVITNHSLVPMTFDAGFSVAPKVGQRSVLTIALDYRDIKNSTQAATGRRLNFGLELGVSRAFFVRTGVSRGYWTAGFGLSSAFGSIDLGTYAEELEATRLRRVEDRRYSLRYGSKF